ncbi:hypothetical protein [Vibrio sp. NH-UV-68]|uniref:hypothetical protein n=1 Tax=unclassified Vibrio TaxID=2614977 RepID=UPI0036F29448
MNRAIVLGFVLWCGLPELRTIFNVVVLFCRFRRYLLVGIQLCGIAFPKGLLAAFSQLSTALLVPSGFSDRRFKTAPDLSFSRCSKTVLAKWK